LDLFYQECLEYGRRLREAGVPVHEEIARGAFHAFDHLADKAPISVKFFASQRDQLWTALAAPADDHLR
jgi:acetyl esterase/lipase